jgi:hypothetical protein
MFLQGALHLLEVCVEGLLSRFGCGGEFGQGLEDAIMVILGQQVPEVIVGVLLIDLCEHNIMASDEKKNKYHFQM